MESKCMEWGSESVGGYIGGVNGWGGGRVVLGSTVVNLVMKEVTRRRRLFWKGKGERKGEGMNKVT